MELFRAAVGDVDRRVSLTVCDESCGAYNSIGKVTHADAVGHVSHVEEVTCRALDSFLAAEGVRRVDVVKIDVEGAEELVLRGGRQLFSSVDGPILPAKLS